MSALYHALARYEVLIYIFLALGALLTARGAWRAWNEWRLAIFSLEREFALRRLSQQVALLALILVLACGEFAVATFIVPGLPASEILPTPTINPLGTPLSNAAQGCTTSIRITSPKSGSEISGNVEIRGTIDVPDFGFYQYEYAPLGSENWIAIRADRQSGQEISLGSWNTMLIPPGDYQLRLVVVDTSGRILPPCVITVRVKEGG